MKVGKISGESGIHLTFEASPFTPQVERWKQARRHDHKAARSSETPVLLPNHIDLGPLTLRSWGLPQACQMCSRNGKRECWRLRTIPELAPLSPAWSDQNILEIASILGLSFDLGRIIGRCDRIHR